jgi:hypothetical protein
VPGFQVRRNDLSQFRLSETAPLTARDGEVVLRVDCFGLTANNITYALLGDKLRYWDHFPAPEGWGVVPVWGFAEVDQSTVEGIDPGTRLYGLLPPASYLVVRPTAVSPHGFVDDSPHRRMLPSAYRHYSRSDTDPYYRPDTEPLQTLLRPLFLTSFLIDDLLDDEGLTKQGPIVISSASSRTALAVAFLLSRRGAPTIALTSPRNAAFVDSLRLFNETVTYNSISNLGKGPATLVDIAGNRTVRQEVRAHYGHDLRKCIVVGASHGEVFLGGADDEFGSAPTLFFAPDRITKRLSDWGGEQLTGTAAAAWHPFSEWCGNWLEAVSGVGFDAVPSAYIDTLEGRLGPEHAHVLTL